MKIVRATLALFTVIAFSSCSKDNHTYNNPNLLDITVDFTIYTDLPQFTPLKFALNPVFVDGYGNGGVVIVNLGSENYIAFDAADPNHPAENCSTLMINGIEGECQCEDHNTYNLISGTVIEEKSEGEDFEYAMKPYQVINNHDGSLRVKN